MGKDTPVYNYRADVKERVQKLRSGLKWEAYEEKTPNWFPGKKKAAARAKQTQADSVKGFKTRKK